MSVKTHSSSLFVVSYDAPHVEYGTIKPAGAQKRKSDSESDDSGQAASTGRVQCCVKAKPWSLDLGGNVDFRACEVSCVLLLSDTEKAVETRTVDALQFSVRPSKDGHTANVELKISVLSSQYEGALFKLRFDCVTNKQKLTCFSESIKVVSKKSQLEKSEVKKRTRTTQVATREAVLEMLEKIEERDVEMKRQLSAISSTVNNLKLGKGVTTLDEPRTPAKALDTALDMIAAMAPSARQALAHNLTPQKLALLQEVAGIAINFPEPPPLNLSANGFDFRTTSLNNMNVGALFEM